MSVSGQTGETGGSKIAFRTAAGAHGLEATPGLRHISGSEQKLDYSSDHIVQTLLHTPLSLFEVFETGRSSLAIDRDLHDFGTPPVASALSLFQIKAGRNGPGSCLLHASCCCSLIAPVGRIGYCSVV